MSLAGGAVVPPRFFGANNSPARQRIGPQHYFHLPTRPDFSYHDRRRLAQLVWTRPGRGSGGLGREKPLQNRYTHVGGYRGFTFLLLERHVTSVVQSGAAHPSPRDGAPTPRRAARLDGSAERPAPTATEVERVRAEHGEHIKDEEIKMWVDLFASFVFV